MKKLLIALVVVCALAGQVFACAAITKKGTQCKRAPSPGSQYCWQHGGTTKAQRAAGLTEADVAKLRCKAMTKAGTQCKRTAKSGSDYCWQHEGSANVSKNSSVSELVASDKDEATIKGEATSVERTQCDAITKKGTRCSRKALSGGTKCWQHAK